MTALGPAGPRRRLGAELRTLRNAAGLHLDQVAERMHCSTSKISRLETGKGIPKVPDVREMLRIYGVTDVDVADSLLQLVEDGRAQGWWEPYIEGVHPERFVLDAPSRYPALETAATAMRSFAPTVMHGLLQTPDYARAVMAAVLPQHSHTEIESLVELRRRRQEALVDPHPSIELAVVLDEAVLCRVVGGPEVMARQLRSVVDLSVLPNVTVQVLSFAEGYHRAHLGPFDVLVFAHDVGTDVVFVEGQAGHAYLENDADVDRYKDVFTDVADRALDPESSRDVIGRYVVDHDQAKGSQQ